MSHILHLRSLFLLFLSICLLAPLQAAWADSATVTIGTAASSNGSWSGASPDVWTPGASGVSTVAVSEITDRLATGGVIIGSGSSITVATPINWNSSNTLTLNAGTDISITAAISATSGALKFYYGSSYSLNNGAKVNLSAGLNFFTKQGSNAETSWTVITSLGSAGSTTGTDLQGISSALSGSYVLGADIDASDTSTWNSNGSGGYYGFSQIGTNTTPFTGSFNGLGHTISNLYINRGSTTYMGLFGYNTGSISNVGVVGGSITGKNRVGGLVGHNSGSISNAYATANITGVYSVGGLVGYNYGGSISNAYATGSASGTNSYTGGLVGWNSGSINYAYATGSVTGTTTDTGGLVGYNSGSISNAYAIGSVTGASNVGGLVGNNAGGTYSNDFWNSTTTGQAYGAGGSTTPTGVTDLTTTQMQSASSFSAWGTEISSSGGSNAVWRIYDGYTYPLLRSFMPTLTVTPAFDGSGTPLTNIADVTAESYNAGLVLGSASTLTLSSSNAGSYTASVNTSGLYSSQQGYDLSYSDRTISTPGSTAGNILFANPITWTSGTLAINTSGSIITTTAINGSGSAIFDLQSGSWSQIGSLPGFSASDFRISGGSFIRALGGDGSSSNPYQITDSYGLQGIGSSADMLTKSYQLANDISASGTASWNSGKGFKPIGSYTTKFTGNMDGQSHTIDGLTINRGSENYVGLFGANFGSISHLALTNANVTGGMCVGALAGYNYSSIANVSVQGSVVATDDFAGLLTGGSNEDGTISNATASGSVSGVNFVGGLTGYNWSVLSNASASVTVTGTYDEVGGLVGENGGSINSSHASGNVTGNQYVGGLVGKNEIGLLSNGGQITDVYATGTVSGVNYVGGLIGTNDANTVISNAYATGSVTGTTEMGGLVGHNDGGSISASYATGNVTGGSGSNMLGGLVGYNNSGSISASYAIGSVSGDEFAGGLVGWNHGSINTSYATGTVTANLDIAGGLVGDNAHGSISNSYATGSVSSTAFVGGLAGANEDSATISNSYVIGAVTGNSYTSVGGLAGINTADSSISNSFFNSDTSGQSYAVGGNVGTLTNVTGKITSELKTASSFSDAGWSISTTGGSSAVWRIYEGKTYPLLRSFLTPMSVTANNAAKNYDATAYSGGNGVLFAPAGYNAAKMLGSLSYAGTSQGATAIGSYTITPDGLFSDQLGYDISFISGVLNINGYWLTLAISGSGSVNSSNGSGLGYACNTATCTAVPFGSGDTVTLTATGSNSTFSSWSGDYVSASNPGSITMNANKAVTATFSAIAAAVKIDGDSTAYYSINSALAVPTQDAIIKATATGFTENVTMENSHTLTLRGGYSDSNFSSQTGYSTINGTLTISSGTLVVDKVVVGP